MADLIDRQALQDTLDGIVRYYIADKSFQCNFAAGVVCDIRDTVIAEMPTVDAVEVVRCKDCEKRRKSADLTDSVLCMWHGFSMPKDGFCSYGERREENESHA